MTNRSALINFFFWVGAAMALNLVILIYWGPTKAAEYFGAWAMEKTLSLDNLFMFYFIFSTFNTPHEARPRALRWGIAGVILMRGAIILGGTTLLTAFHPMLWFFAAFLLWAAYKVFFLEEKEESEEEKQAKLRQNWLVRIATRFLSFDDRYHGSRFWVRVGDRWKPTMLLLVVLVVEGTDVPFAFDSLPAAMAISQDFWIVMSSNLLAVLGLRAIYFLIENMQERFSYMKQGIGILLAFAGVKILLPDIGQIVNVSVGWASPQVASVIPVDFGFHLPLPISVGIIVFVITATILYTLYKTRGMAPAAEGSRAELS